MRSPRDFRSSTNPVSVISAGKSREGVCQGGGDNREDGDEGLVAEFVPGDKLDDFVASFVKMACVDAIETLGLLGQGGRLLRPRSGPRPGGWLTRLRASSWMVVLVDLVLSVLDTRVLVFSGLRDGEKIGPLYP